MTEAERARLLALIRPGTAARAAPDRPALPEKFSSLLFPGPGAAFTGIKAVLLDVYGTLFSSAAGDIGVASDYLRGNLDALAAEFCPRLTGEELKDYFRSAVLAEHLRLFPETPYPEVRVEELWARLPGLAEGADPLELAVRFELAVNPAFPMPGLRECLAELSGAGAALGIVSNAQFFTPLLFDAHLGSSPEELGFDGELLVYSYERREAKPSPALFAAAAEALAKRGIAAEETLYLGNDMLNDVYAARSSGMRTCLFAGDARSLRLREDNALCRGVMPDAVIRDLADLPPLAGFRDAGRG